MQSPNRLRASIVDLTFILWAVAVPLVLHTRLLNADGDFPRHLTMGEFILHGGPFQLDRFAFTHTGPFLTTEWLSQVAYALAYRAGGLAAVAVLAGLLIGATYALIVLFLRRAGVDPLLAYVTGVVAAVLGAPHWVARPHLFTFLGLALLLHIAVHARRHAPWCYALLFATWANFHAGFVLGLALLAAWALGDTCEALLSPDAVHRRAWQHQAASHALGALTGVLAACLNPQGPALLARVTGILSNRWLLRNTAEFAPLDFRTLYGLLFLAVLLSMVATLVLQRRRPPFPRLFVLLLMLAAALYATRNAPLFGVVGLPLLAVEIDPAFRALRARWLRRMRVVFEDGERVARRGRWIPWATAALVLLALSRGAVAGTRVLPDDFDRRSFPVQAVRAARAAALQGHLYNWFVWGGYILHAWPQQKIFIDGMTDFFGNDVLASYMTVERLEPGWREQLRRWDIALVLVPPHSRLAEALRQTPDWQVWYEDATAVLLRRRSYNNTLSGDDTSSAAGAPAASRLARPDGLLARAARP